MKIKSKCEASDKYLLRTILQVDPHAPMMHLYFGQGDLRSHPSVEAPPPSPAPSVPTSPDGGSQATEGFPAQIDPVT